MAESQGAHRPSRNRPWALALAIAALALVLLMPAPADLPRAGQVMLAVFAFALVLWITEA
ncbi:MAG TPA: anion permease, partial [bacterium]